MSTETDFKPEVQTSNHDRDNKASHYVNKADILKANIEGTPAFALCGKKWIPNRNPDSLPVCETCKELMAVLGGGE